MDSEAYRTADCVWDIGSPAVSPRLANLTIISRYLLFLKGNSIRKQLQDQQTVLSVKHHHTETKACCMSANSRCTKFSN